MHVYALHRRVTCKKLLETTDYPGAGQKLPSDSLICAYEAEPKLTWQ